jgi:hypothetical protein
MHSGLGDADLLKLDPKIDEAEVPAESQPNGFLRRSVGQNPYKVYSRSGSAVKAMRAVDTIVKGDISQVFAQSSNPLLAKFNEDLGELDELRLPDAELLANLQRGFEKTEGTGTVTLGNGERNHATQSYLKQFVKPKENVVTSYFFKKLRIPGEEAMNAALPYPLRAPERILGDGGFASQASTSIEVRNEEGAILVPPEQPALHRSRKGGSLVPTTLQSAPGITTSNAIEYYINLARLHALKGEQPLISHLCNLLRDGIHYVVIGHMGIAGPLMMRFSFTEEQIRACEAGDVIIEEAHKRDIVVAFIDIREKSGVAFKKEPAPVTQKGYLWAAVEKVGENYFYKFSQDGVTYSVNLSDTVEKNGAHSTGTKDGKPVHSFRFKAMAPDGALRDCHYHTYEAGSERDSFVECNSL